MGRRKPKPYEVVRWMKVISGPVIRRHRLRKDLTQRQLAYLVGKTQTTIYLIESGQMSTVTEKLALDIAKRLDLPWEDLFEAREASRVSRMTTDARIEQHEHRTQPDVIPLERPQVPA